MSSTNTPPADEQLFESESFAAELFWQRHRVTILLGIGALVIALVAVAAWFINRHESRLAAEAQFAAASNPEAWRDVIAKHPGSAQAANSYFLLAESLRTQGNLGESTATYEKFLEVFPTHQLSGGARLGRAENLELEGKTPEALTALREVTVNAPGSYAAPFAALLEGRIFVRQGKLDDARKVFSSLVSKYSQSPAARFAGGQLEEIIPLLPPDQKKPAQ